jgi:tetratricopeptide (TPR) repeat protein
MSEQAAELQTAAATPGDIAARRASGHDLFRQGRYEEALEAWQRVESSDASDEEAPRMIAATVIAENRQQAGLDVPGLRLRRLQPRPLQKPSFALPSAADSSLASHVPAGASLNPLQQMEAAIRDRPSIPELYLQLAQAYLDKDRDYDAERLLSKGREATDHDPRVHEMWEEVSMLRHARRVELAEQDVKAADNPQTRTALEQAVKDRDKNELDIFRGRVKRQGADGAAHYGLGVRLQRADRVRDACTHLEKALADDNVRSPAALALGNSLKQLDDVPGALRHYRLAAETAIWTEHQACRIEALKHAAQLAAQMKMPKLAERYATELSRIQ